MDNRLIDNLYTLQQNPPIALQNVEDLNTLAPEPLPSDTGIDNHSWKLFHLLSRLYHSSHKFILKQIANNPMGH